MYKESIQHQSCWFLTNELFDLDLDLDTVAIVDILELPAPSITCSREICSHSWFNTVLSFVTHSCYHGKSVPSSIIHVRSAIWICYLTMLYEIVKTLFTHSPVSNMLVTVTISDFTSSSTMALYSIKLEAFMTRKSGSF